MTSRDIDQLLQGWNDRLNTAAQNLVDLRNHRTYLRLAGIGCKQAELTGQTAARVQPVLRSMPGLFDHFDRVRSKVSEAMAIRRDLPIFGAEEKLVEIEYLLSTASIRLPRDPLPLDQRSLVSSFEEVERVTPTDLLNAMTRAYERARDTVLAVDAAWSELPWELDQILSERQRLIAAATENGFPVPANVVTMDRSVENIRQQLETDPLGCEQGIAGLSQCLDQFRSTVDHLTKQRERMEQSFREARSLIGELKSAHEESKRVWEERAAKIADGGTPVAALPDAQMNGLASWLERLERKRAEGLGAPLIMGLENWRSAAGQSLAAARRAIAANRAAIEMRNELRGRLEALKAKARAYGLAEQAQLCALDHEATAILYTRPAPLARAESVVSRYENVLNGMAHGNGQGHGA